MSWSDTFPVYLDNLSTFYTFSVLLAIVALFAAHYYQGAADTLQVKAKRKHSDAKNGQEESSDNNDKADTIESPYVKGEFGGALGKIKAAQHNVLLKSLGADDTEEQKNLEKKVQEEQLTAIWELLRQQEEKFMVGSKEELQEQLRLYRS
ncbi:Hypothetical predicted protein [Cloeon dipterum]|uniref:Matrix-remodeling-associated protein 7 helical domain-containing protein n=1 Tax=Cloeon dipterum TaxID=197152 RepID=A0A8S1C4T0_9INSE|nr:Hypothetical predicted protein [Cloeon dipterum]